MSLPHRSIRYYLPRLTLILVVLALYGYFFGNRHIDAVYHVRVHAEAPTQAPFMIHSVFECPSLHNSTGCFSSKLLVPPDVPTTHNLGRVYGYFGHKAWLQHPEYLMMPVGGGGTYSHKPALRIQQELRPMSWYAAIDNIGSPHIGDAGYYCATLQRCHAYIFRHMRWLRDTYVPTLIQQKQPVPDYRKVVTLLRDFYFAAYARYPDQLKRERNSMADGTVRTAYRVLMYSFERMYPQAGADGELGPFNADGWLQRDPLDSWPTVRDVVMTGRDRAILQAIKGLPLNPEAVQLTHPDGLQFQWHSSDGVHRYQLNSAVTQVSEHIEWRSLCQSDQLTVQAEGEGPRRHDDPSNNCARHDVEFQLRGQRGTAWLLEMDNIELGSRRWVDQYEQVFRQLKQEIKNDTPLINQIAHSDPQTHHSIAGAAKYTETEYPRKELMWLPNLVRQHYNEKVQRVGGTLITIFERLEARPEFDEVEQRQFVLQRQRVERLLKDLPYSEAELDTARTDKWAAAVRGNQTAFFQLAEYFMKRGDYKVARQLYSLMPEMDEKARKKAISLLR